MLLGASKDLKEKNNRFLGINTLLFFAFFVFYFIFSIYVLPKAFAASDLKSIVQASFSFTIAISIVAGAFLIDKLKLHELKVVLASLAFTTILIFPLLLVPNSVNTIFGLLTILMSGVSFGFGQLAFFAYFWQQSESFGRGKMSGKIGFLALVPYFFVNAAVVVDTGMFLTLIMAVIPLLVALTVISANLKKDKNPKNPDAIVYHEKRTILLYSVPWIFFCLINATLSKNISSAAAQLVSSYFLPLALIQTIASLVGAYSAGAIADNFGRRPALAVSITLYGVSMAIYGFIPSLYIFSFAVAAEGLSWGMLLILYSFVIWGDLANQNNRAKMYAIGLIAFYVATTIGQISTPLSQIDPTNSALIGCSLIFLSNTPILLAPELLSIDIRQNLRLNRYIDHVKRREEKLRG
jgi:hypothetical protein